MWKQQKALTILTPIKQDEVGQLREVLKRIMDEDVEENDLVPFGKLTKVHFARWAIIDKIHEKPVPPRLVFSTNYDASLKSYLKELINVAGSGLDQIYSHCKDYPGAKGLRGYLKSHRVGYGAFHVAIPSHSVARIHKEAKLRDAIEIYVDENRSDPNWAGHKNPVDILAAIKKFVSTDFRWALSSAPKPKFFWKVKYWGKLVLALLVLILILMPILSIFLLPFLPLSLPLTEFLPKVAPLLPGALVVSLILLVPKGRTILRIVFAALVAFVFFLFYKGALLTSWWLYFAVFFALAIIIILYFLIFFALLLAMSLYIVVLHSNEESDLQTPNIRYSQHDIYLASLENKIVQNQMTNIGPVKAGILRRTTLWLVLKAIEVVARYIFTKGILAGVTTIYFARWVIIDKGRSLIFFSNYGGSWESYLGDFIDKASVGLSAIWSNTMLYPKTSWLVLDGAKDEQRFKVWAREQQIVTDVWYSAYKTLSVSNIINNSEIRNGLAREMNPEEARAWLRRL